jgi:uncharacterized 2Fe-2S/4Fe-4S cluster protein (DUF4445 family)
MSAEVVFQPIGIRCAGETGDSILDVAQMNGVGISSICGGVGTCGDCRVHIRSGDVTPLNDLELTLLEDRHFARGLRLACQACITDADGQIVIDIPRESQLIEQHSQVEGEDVTLPLAPSVVIHELHGVPPSSRDVRGDWERLNAGDHWVMTAPVMAALPPLLRAHDWRVRLVAEGSRIAAFLPPGCAPLGFAVDVGTTGLAGYLVDLETGATLAAAGSTNPQIAFGEDVMSRLAAVNRDPERRALMQASLVAELNRLIGILCERAGTAPDRVVEIAAVGNTAMHHLLFGLPTRQLGLSPYVPALACALATPARDLCLAVAPGAMIFSPPCVAGFVGADHVAMLLASRTTTDGVTLYVDIGTNTEISLVVDGEHWCCSAPSGPAFEGAQIDHGMRAAAGAVERVRWDDGLRCKTIADAPPIGICGSGIIDAVAVVRQQGIAALSGAFKRDHPLVRRDGDRSWIVLVDADATATGQPITLSRSDIAEIQMAKAAIRTGIKLLLEESGLDEADVERLVLAGAFGSYIDPASAVAIGLLPVLPVERIRQVGNAAGIGAKRLLLNVDERERARAMVADMHYIELPTHADFKDRFSQALRLTADVWD